MSLIIAKNMVSNEELAKVKTPDPTIATEGRFAGKVTHQPLPHHQLAKLVRKSLGEAGYEIKEEEHAIARGGLRYFGGFAVTGPEVMAEDRMLVVGLRNSHDKGFAASLCLGNSMLVCENLCFSSTIKLARRHTGFILRDIEAVIAKGIARLSDVFADMSKRIAAYQGYAINHEQVSDIVYSLAAKGALPPRYMFNVIKEWEEPRHEEFKGSNLWNLYNAVTEQLKGSDLAKLPDRTKVLQTVLDGVVSPIVEVEAEAVPVEVIEAEVVEND